MKPDHKKIFNKLEEKVKSEKGMPIPRKRIKDYLDSRFFVDLNEEMEKIHEANNIQRGNFLVNLYIGLHSLFENKILFKKQVLKSYYKWQKEAKVLNQFYYGLMAYLIGLAFENDKNFELIQKIRLNISEEAEFNLTEDKKAKEAYWAFLKTINLYYEKEKRGFAFLYDFLERIIQIDFQKNGFKDFLLQRDNWKEIVLLILKEIKAGNHLACIIVNDFLANKEDISIEDEMEIIENLLKYIKKDRFHKDGMDKLAKEISTYPNLIQYFKISDEIFKDQPIKEQEWLTSFKESIFKDMKPEKKLKLLEDMKNITIEEKNKEIDELSHILEITKMELRNLQEKRGMKFWEKYKNDRLSEIIREEKERASQTETQEKIKETNEIIKKIVDIYEDIKQLSEIIAETNELKRIQRICKGIFNDFNVREADQRGTTQPYDPIKYELINKLNKEIKLVRILRPSIVRYIKGRAFIMKKALVEKVD